MPLRSMRLPRNPVLWLGVILVLCALAASCGRDPVLSPHPVCAADKAVRADTLWTIPAHTVYAVVLECR